MILESVKEKMSAQGFQEKDSLVNLIDSNILVMEHNGSDVYIILCDEDTTREELFRSFELTIHNTKTFYMVTDSNSTLNGKAKPSLYFWVSNKLGSQPNEFLTRVYINHLENINKENLEWDYFPF